MSEASTEPTTPAAPEPAQEPSASWDDLFKGEDPARVREALDQSRKWESRAKANAEAAKRVAEFEKERKATMSESERAIAEAETRGRTAATTELGKRLATAEIRAAAATAGADLAGVFDYLDLTRFVGEDGEPDAKAVKSFVEGLPSKDTGPAAFDGGARGTAKAEDFNAILRKAAGRA